MSTKHEDIILIANLTQSTVKHDKKTNDSYVVTQFKGVAREGLLANFSQRIDNFVFQVPDWTSIKARTVTGEWTLKISDTRTAQEIVFLPVCHIQNMAFSRKKEGVIEVTILIEHGLTGLQPALNAAVSATVSVSLTKNRENIVLADDVK